MTKRRSDTKHLDDAHEHLRAATPQPQGEDALATFAQRLRAAGQADLEEFESIRHTSRDV